MCILRLQLLYSELIIVYNTFMYMSVIFNKTYLQLVNLVLVKGDIRTQFPIELQILLCEHLVLLCFYNFDILLDYHLLLMFQFSDHLLDNFLIRYLFKFDGIYLATVSILYI